ncbi:MAG: ribosome maturation factor RimP, partial [Candidatus Coatesbacteria bacterium]|nr:ribosome maturation factor RimP [Candidatus Coatesbacteria bacterium]
EVSSPGVLRPLKKPVDFERFCGRSVKISLLRMIERRKRFIGVIREVKWAEGEATIVFEISPDEMFEVPFESIQRANLHYTTKELLAGIDRE